MKINKHQVELGIQFGKLLAHYSNDSTSNKEIKIGKKYITFAFSNLGGDGITHSIKYNRKRDKFCFEITPAENTSAGERKMFWFFSTDEELETLLQEEFEQ